MAIDVVVVRGVGSHQGPDIVDPYITSLEVALARGRNELDDTASGLQPVDLEVPYYGAARPGLVVEVNDTELNEQWFGVIQTAGHRASGVQRLTNLRVQRVTQFRTGI